MTNRSNLFSGTCLVVALCISSASAQMHGSLGVTLPQSFTVSGLKLPAGEYSIHELSGSGVNKVLLFRSAAGVSTNVLAESITRTQQTTATVSSVTLHQVGSQLQLEQVWLAGSDVGYQIISLDK